jgi:hypothetical protein
MQGGRIAAYFISGNQVSGKNSQLAGESAWFTSGNDRQVWAGWGGGWGGMSAYGQIKRISDISIYGEIEKLAAKIRNKG